MLQRVAIWLQKRPFCLASLVMAGLFGLTLLVVRPVYETNDDVVLSMIASGTGIGVAPDEHLVFSNVGIGLVLKWLYNQVPNFPWYGSYLVAAQYLAFTALLYSLLVWRFSRNYLWLFVLVFALVGVSSIVYLQFTRVAFLATESGIVLALTALYRRADDSQYRPLGMLIAASCLMVLGALIRPGSFYGACAVALPVVVFSVWRLAKESQQRAAIWFPAVLTATTVMCLAVGAQLGNAAYYENDPAWRDFFAFNTARAHFNDFNRIQYSPETRAVFDAVRWSENDHAMIFNFFVDDESVYSLENLTAIINGRDWPRSAGTWKNIPSWLGSIWMDPGLWAMWALLPLFYWAANDRRAFLQALLLITCSIVGMLLALMLFVKNPEARVYFPLHAFQLLLALLAVRVGSREQRPSDGQIFTLHRTRVGDTGRSEPTVLVQVSGAKLIAGYGACALLLLGSMEYQWYKRSRTIVKANAELYATLAEFKPKSDDVFVAWGCCLPFELMLPFDAPAKNSHFQLLHLGCLTHSPIHHAMKQRHRIDETATALMSRPNVHLISCDQLNGFFTTYAREHFKTDLNWVNTHAGKRFAVWKPQPKPLTLESKEQNAAVSLSPPNPETAEHPTTLPKKR